MISNTNTDAIEARESNSVSSPLPIRKMHNIILGMVGLLFFIAATYPLSMYRVAQKDDGWGEKVKVKGVYLKSLNEAKESMEVK